jgi:hypothetical protein
LLLQLSSGEDAATILGSWRFSCRAIVFCSRSPPSAPPAKDAGAHIEAKQKPPVLPDGGKLTARLSH